MERKIRISRNDDMYKPITVNIMTPVQDTSFSLIVIKTIKYILYQRQQIPFTYEFLMDVARKGQGLLCEERKQVQSGNSRDSVSLRRQYRKIVDSYETLEEIFKNIHEEINQSSSHFVLEVMLVLGSTPLNPKEVYRIILPEYGEDKSLGNKCSKTNIFNAFRGIMTCDELQNLVTTSIAATNTFIFVKKRAGMKSTWLFPKHSYKLPSKGQHVIFSLQSPQAIEVLHEQEEHTAPQGNAAVYLDCKEQEKETQNKALPFSNDNLVVIESQKACLPVNDSKRTDESEWFTDTVQWYQAKNIFKGFVTNIKL